MHSTVLARPRLATLFSDSAGTACFLMSSFPLLHAQMLPSSHKAYFNCSAPPALLDFSVKSTSKPAVPGAASGVASSDDHRSMWRARVFIENWWGK